MESGSSKNARGIISSPIYRSDAWMIPRWWRIFCKVKFVRIVSNIFVQAESCPIRTPVF